MLLVVCQLSRDVIGYEDSYIRVFIANNMATYLTNQINNQSIIPSTDVTQLTLTLKMTIAQVVETSVTVNNNCFSTVWLLFRAAATLPLSPSLQRTSTRGPWQRSFSYAIKLFYTTNCFRLLMLIKNYSLLDK